MNKELEDRLIQRVITDELGTARRNKQYDDEEFESYINLIDSVREAKQYDWMSDIRIPEFISHVLTQSSIDANQYFQSRDFVEVYLQDESDEAIANSAAAKELINRTLNQKHLYHYFKYMKAKTLNNVTGRTYAVCWWEKEYKDQDDGPPKLKVDRFNYDVLDPRNVFTDNKYVYTLQQKDYVFIRSEQSLESLKDKEESMNYFGLKELYEVNADRETETSSESYNKGMQTNKQEKVPNPLAKYFDVFDRYGKFWCIITENDDDGYPIKVDIGIDENGEVKDGAVFIETIMSFVVSGSTTKLIRFQPQPYKDAMGNALRPLIRGLCYIHPTNDGGVGDGKHTKELQLALDDTLNISNDRVMLATLPTFITKKYSSDDNLDIYFQPGHNIPLENPKEDLSILDIRDNIQGAMVQAQFLQRMMQQVDATYPTTMGDVGVASTTATAIAGSETRSNMRANYKSLTFENTFLVELYCMIMYMTWQFADSETGLKLAGEKIYAFDPNKDYFYKPVTSAIEPESSKQAKLKNYSTILGYVTSIQHPDMVNILNYLLQKMFELMGDEYVNFSNKLLNPQKPMTPSGGTNLVAMQGTPPSNQAGVAMSQPEMAMRGM